MGPGIFSLCREAFESVSHIFVHCNFAKTVWNHICSVLHIKQVWLLDSIEDCMKK